MLASAFSVIRGEDDRYHMFYAVWDAGPEKPPFQDGWLLGSEIAYAVSDYPDRGYAFQKILLTGRKNDGVPDAWDAQTVHNPHVRRFGDSYYLYYIGSRDPGPQPAGVSHILRLPGRSETAWSRLRLRSGMGWGKSSRAAVAVCLEARGVHC